VSPFAYFLLVGLGLPGILVLLQFAQLCPQLVAEQAPLKFMNSRVCFCVAYLALCIETLQLTSFSWVLFGLCKNQMDGPDSRNGSGGGDKTPIPVEEEEEDAGQRNPVRATAVGGVVLYESRTYADGTVAV
jgi:hypothetical protein